MPEALVGEYPSAPIVSPESDGSQQPERPETMVEALHRIELEKTGWVDQHIEQSQAAVQSFLIDPGQTKQRLLGITLDSGFDGLGCLNRVMDALKEKTGADPRLGSRLVQEIDYQKGKEFMVSISEMEDGVYLREIFNHESSRWRSGRLKDQGQVVLEIIRSSDIEKIKDEARALDPSKLFKEIPADNPPASQETMSVADFLRSHWEILRAITPEDQETSNVRLIMRCLGHSAIGTEISDDEEMPPVSPWKLVKTFGHATVNAQKRREVLGRLVEAVTPGDLLGFLAAPYFFRMGKEEGMNDSSAAAYALTLQKPIPESRSD